MLGRMYSIIFLHIELLPFLWYNLVIYAFYATVKIQKYQIINRGLAILHSKLWHCSFCQQKFQTCRLSFLGPKLVIQKPVVKSTIILARDPRTARLQGSNSLRKESPCSQYTVQRKRQPSCIHGRSHTAKR